MDIVSIILVVHWIVFNLLRSSTHIFSYFSCPNGIQQHDIVLNSNRADAYTPPTSLAQLGRYKVIRVPLSHVGDGTEVIYCVIISKSRRLNKGFSFDDHGSKLHNYWILLKYNIIIFIWYYYGIFRNVNTWFSKNHFALSYQWYGTVSLSPNFVCTVHVQTKFEI